MRQARRPDPIRRALDGDTTTSRIRSSSPMPWEPKISFAALVREMMREDRKEAERGALCARDGDRVLDRNESFFAAESRVTVSMRRAPTLVSGIADRSVSVDRVAHDPMNDANTLTCATHVCRFITCQR